MNTKKMNPALLIIIFQLWCYKVQINTLCCLNNIHFRGHGPLRSSQTNRGSYCHQAQWLKMFGVLVRTDICVLYIDISCQPCVFFSSVSHLNYDGPSCSTGIQRERSATACMCPGSTELWRVVMSEAFWKVIIKRGQISILIFLRTW